MQQYKVAIQMDALAKLNHQSDSTLLLAREAEKRGCRLYYYQPEHLLLLDGRVMAYVREFEAESLELKSPYLLALEECDVVLMRQDPPFDLKYITATYLLEKLPPSVVVVNNPAEVRNCPEKLFVCDFPDFMPPTLITQDERAIREFIAVHQDVVFKPLYSAAGSDVKRLGSDAAETIAFFANKYDHPIVIQKYLPEVRQGDKRIILANGKIVGAFLRIPPEGQITANLAVGGMAAKTILSQRDLEICAVFGPELAARGIIFAGLDVIGEYVTEINITSPTGLAALNELYGTNGAAMLWDEILSLLEN